MAIAVKRVIDSKRVAELIKAQLAAHERWCFSSPKLASHCSFASDIKAIVDNPPLVQKLHACSDCTH